VVSACAAIAALVLGVRSTHHLWIAALAMLILALGLALRHCACQEPRRTARRW
jgi:hypothetical protein